MQFIKQSIYGFDENSRMSIYIEVLASGLCYIVEFKPFWFIHSNYVVYILFEIGKYFIL